MAFGNDQDINVNIRVNSEGEDKIKALENSSKSVSSTLKAGEAQWASYGKAVGDAIKNPLAAAGEGFTSLITKVGAAGAAYTAFGAVAAVALKEAISLAKELGDEAERIQNTSIRTG